MCRACTTKRGKTVDNRPAALVDAYIFFPFFHVAIRNYCSIAIPPVSQHIATSFFFFLHSYNYNLCHHTWQHIAHSRGREFRERTNELENCKVHFSFFFTVLVLHCLFCVSLVCTFEYSIGFFTGKDIERHLYPFVLHLNWNKRAVNLSDKTRKIKWKHSKTSI